MKTLALVFAFSAFCSTLFSQTSQVHIQGVVTKPGGQSIEAVTLSVLAGNTEVYSTLTSASGSFDFVIDLQENQTYQLYAEKTEDGSISILNGITTFDLILISKHILGMMPFTSPYQIIAADVNGNGSISTFDLVILRNLILGFNLPNLRPWRFVKAGCDPFADPDNCPLDYVMTFTTNTDMTGLEIIGIKIGDVSN